MFQLPRVLTLRISDRIVRPSEVLRLRRLGRVMHGRHRSDGMRNAVLVAIALRARELRGAPRGACDRTVEWAS